MKIFFVLVTLVLLTLSGCAGITMIDKHSQTKFNYDFALKGQNKNEIFKKARDYFATVYGDSRSVFRMVDESDGSMIGRGSAKWNIASMHCMTDYHIRFAAKDEKARLQLELIYGVPPFCDCVGWPFPPQNGYKEVVQTFESTAQGLEKWLQGTAPTSDFKNF